MLAQMKTLSRGCSARDEKEQTHTKPYRLSYVVALATSHSEIMAHL